MTTITQLPQKIKEKYEQHKDFISSCSTPIPLNDYRPHISITTPTCVHIIPRRFFEEIINGSLQITQLVDHEEIVPIIIKEWLDGFKKP